MQRLLVELQSNYAQEPAYQMFERVFGEHYLVEESLSSRHLQIEKLSC